MPAKPVIRAFFDEATNTVSYLVVDPETCRAAVIDPVLDFDPKSGVTDDHSVKAILAAARANGYAIEWSLETHAHADHLSGSPYVKAKTGAHRRTHQGRPADLQAGFQCNGHEGRWKRL